jgi:hypothetical protein
MDEQILLAIKEHLEAGKLACSQAHAIAEAFGVEPIEVGRAADGADIRIFRCQLGLFGYGPKSEGKHKIVHAMEEVPQRLAARLRAAAGEDGITCFQVWQIADEMGYQRLEASSAVEAMGLRVSRCQLGCFPHPWEA